MPASCNSATLIRYRRIGIGRDRETVRDRETKIHRETEIGRERQI